MGSGSTTYLIYHSFSKIYVFNFVSLGCTKGLWLAFEGRTTTLVEGYCDVDWEAPALNLGILLPFRKRGHTLGLEEAILSSTEAEYIAQTHAAKEARWLRTFLREIPGLHVETPNVNCDIQYHFVREPVEDGRISEKHISTDGNTADIFTKPLAKPKSQGFV